ncbi:hypothetical protein B0T26DRAFT_868978 [Lasiosphaeria miniovina]|uniref:Uncharacterized protein n=1 Tax=Lasiosphaeria miniovina TaxID=1954250 RepID=A0AA40B518_9PEZI|nr:uncharacterized protein B0T26DRAFT_868978 [Lasiosphaeria miniovina]KAK0727767.1 hypothetical protein B0T26DRAFT_868978 [Lasiosphaeria miniovina]
MANFRSLVESPASVCLRLACKLRLRDRSLQASGDFHREERLLLYRTNFGMNYGLVELARETAEELDSEPHGFFSTVCLCQRPPRDTWIAFSSCVERTAFANSVRFLEHLKNEPPSPLGSRFLSLSPDPRQHGLGDYQKLVHAARVYIFQEKWAEALALLTCSCSLGVHFHVSVGSPAPKELDPSAKYDSWAEEALRYAEMGKARGIGDSLQKHHGAGFLDANPKTRLQGDEGRLEQLPT